MYHMIIHHILDTIQTIIDINQNSIAIGIVHATNILAIGDRIEICQKLKIIIGSVKVREARDKTKAVFISRKLGIK